MRTLTSVQSATNVVADLQFHLTASDQSTTWIFGRDDIRSLGRISWEVPFMGGVGKTSNYNITLTSSAGWVRDYLYKTVKGEAYLKVFVNSDNFTPHAGRVRGIQRDGFDPNKITLQVFDKFLDAVPKVPLESIVDSYSIVHPEVLNADMGYPLYYGKHTRPFYMTPVDCDIGALLGPRNVSSANHVSSVWFNSDFNSGQYDLQAPHVILTSKAWEQQSGHTNISSSANGLEIRSKGAVTYFEFTAENRSSNLTVSINRVSSEGLIAYARYGVVTAYAKYGDQAGDPRNIAHVALHSVINKNIFATTYIKGRSYLNEVDIGSIDNHVIGIGCVGSDGGVVYNELAAMYTRPNTLVFDYEYYPTSGSPSSKILRNDFSEHYLGHFWDLSFSTGGGGYWTSSLDMRAQLESAAYVNYSVFASQVNCSDIAISENPVTILQDIIDQSSYGYVTSQASQGQVDTSSYNFQCFFGEREKLSDIMDEFGRLTSEYIWIGDSGYINFNCYQESAGGIEDYTLCMSDFFTLSVKDNPLGTTSFETSKAKRIKLNYSYNHQIAAYDNTLVADPLNTAACNSVYASGVDKEVTVQTKYVMETETASLCLGNLIDKYTKEDMIISGTLPARYFGMEPTDILKIEHPTFPNSVSLFQVTNLAPDYLNGTLYVMAYRV